VRGRLLDELGAPLPGWSVVVQSGTGGFLQASEPVFTDEAGQFSIYELVASSFAFVLRSPADGAVVVREDFRLDGSEIDLRLRPEDRPTGFLEGLLVGPQGELLRDARVEVCRSWSIIDRQAWLEANTGQSGGRFRLGPLSPGEYVLVASSEGLPALELRTRVESHATRYLGTLCLEAPGWIAVDVVHPGVTLGPTEVVSTVLRRDGIHPSGSIRNGPGSAMPPTGMCGFGASLLEALPPRGRSRDLAPGRYVLSTRDRRWAASDVCVDVLPGRTTWVEVTLVPATTRTIEVLVPETAPFVRLDLKVSSSDGKTCWDEEVTCRARGGRFVHDVQGLLTGTYRLEARSPGGGRLEAEFQVLDLGRASPIEVAF